MKCTSRKRSCNILSNNNGSILSRVIIALVTLILIGGALYFLLEKKEENIKDNHRKAEVISDYGLQLIMGKINESLNDDPTKIGNIEKTEYDEGLYEIIITSALKDSMLTLNIESKGYCGDQSFSRKENVVLCRSVVDGDSVWVPRIEK